METRRGSKVTPQLGAITSKTKVPIITTAVASVGKQPIGV